MRLSVWSPSIVGDVLTSRVGQREREESDDDEDEDHDDDHDPRGE